MVAQLVQAAEHITVQGSRTRLQDPEVWGFRWLQDGMEGKMHYQRKGQIGDLAS